MKYTKENLVGVKFCSSSVFVDQYTVQKLNEDGRNCTIVYSGNNQIANNSYPIRSLLEDLNLGAWGSEKPGTINTYTIY